MITGRDFIVFSDDWGRHPSSCQHLFRRLLGANRVIWVNTIGTRSPTLSRADLARAAGKIRAWTSPAPRGGEGPPGPAPAAVLEPFMTPFDAWRIGRRWNTALLVRALRRECAARRLDRPILVTTIPNAAGVVGALEEALAVYYCVDDFSEWPGAHRGAMRTMERELLAKADLVIATSDALFEDKSRVHPLVRLVRHGVDWDAFHEGRGRVPPELAALPRPRVGITGLLDARIDVALVDALAAAVPEASFALLGPRQIPPGPLDARPNVRFLPAVPYDDVPAVLHALDAALIPYVENALTERINPLKLRESMASGTPVVSTPLPEAARYADVVEIARGPVAFEAALRRALAEGRTRAGERAARVRGEGWDARAEEFSRHTIDAEERVRPVP